MGKTALTVGDKAPAFSLQATSGKTVTLSDFLGKPVVLYFYPKDDTSGCTKEACGFQAHLPQFGRIGAVILGVSPDPVESHQRFAGKFGLTFPLLADPEAAVSKTYGVYKQKSMYGRTYWGIERTTFILDEQGRIARIFPKVSVDGHTQEVLEALKGTAGSDTKTPQARAARASTR